MEIIQQRLEREEDMDLVQTAPNVTYNILKNDGELIEIHSPAELPDPNHIDEYREPIVECNIVVPTESIGAVMTLCTERRGTYRKTEHYGRERVMISFTMPFSEIIYDFHDRLKSMTRGYGTMDYELSGYHAADLVKVRLLVNGEEVDALSMICHRETSERRGRAILKKLRKEIPRHMFEVALQAAIGGKIIARESIRALSKNVTAKCYGGDITRKRKLLEKQKKGKKRMKQVGNVEIPQKAFLVVLQSDDDDKR
jgi:GTP-binding protein LepA